MARNKLLLRQITPELHFYVCFAWFLCLIKLSPLYQNISKKSIIIVLIFRCYFYNTHCSIRGRSAKFYIVIFTTDRPKLDHIPAQFYWLFIIICVPGSYFRYSRRENPGLVVFYYLLIFRLQKSSIFSQHFSNRVVRNSVKNTTHFLLT